MERSIRRSACPCSGRRAACLVGRISRRSISLRGVSSSGGHRSRPGRWRVDSSRCKPMSLDCRKRRSLVEHMNTKQRAEYFCSFMLTAVCFFGAAAVGAEPVASPGQWARDNLFAWAISVDSVVRTPEERAQMLARLGFEQVGYDWVGDDIATFDQQIEAFKRHGIK